jgi:hypothetical protein
VFLVDEKKGEASDEGGGLVRQPIEVATVVLGVSQYIARGSHTLVEIRSNKIGFSCYF